MIINYSEDLTKQEFYEGGKTLNSIVEGDFLHGQLIKLGEINNPVVVFDKEKLSKLENGELIKYLFVESNIPVGIFYNKQRNGLNYWLKLEQTWPATIDSLIHLRGQAKYFEKNLFDKVLHILDMGCGTGIAGQYAHLNHNLSLIDFSDINQDNLSMAQNSMPGSTRILSDGFENIKDKYDLIIASAIPATPIYNGLKRPINPLFEGTNFLEKILRDSPNHLNEGGSLILSYSSVGEIEFNDFAKKYGAKTELLDEKEVCFKTEFLGDENWVKYLIELGGLRKEQKQEHSYWHDVKVKEITFE